jgi:hypothetical protein
MLILHPMAGSMRACEEEVLHLGPLLVNPGGGAKWSIVEVAN